VELTSEAFEKLLSCFSPDRDEAASQYEVLRTKLIRFFDWRRADIADALADETFDRAARRIDEGVKIDNIRSYVWAVARLVLLEHLKRDHISVPLEPVHDKCLHPVVIEPEPEQRLECLDRCLEALPADSHQLIIDYYQEQRRAKIELRLKLAEKLGIPPNALRIRAHRIRATLEKCVTKCVQLVEVAK
jgi:DNA-directed RNA polymerase specialized sigma24 family protein